MTTFTQQPGSGGIWTEPSGLVIIKQREPNRFQVTALPTNENWFVTTFEHASELGSSEVSRLSAIRRQDTNTATVQPMLETPIDPSLDLGIAPEDVARAAPSASADLAALAAEGSAPEQALRPDLSIPHGALFDDAREWDFMFAGTEVPYTARYEKGSLTAFPAGQPERISFRLEVGTVMSALTWLTAPNVSLCSDWRELAMSGRFVS